jgi:hypothetical protein
MYNINLLNFNFNFFILAPYIINLRVSGKRKTDLKC